MYDIIALQDLMHDATQDAEQTAHAAAKDDGTGFDDWYEAKFAASKDVQTKHTQSKEDADATHWQNAVKAAAEVLRAELAEQTKQHKKELQRERASNEQLRSKLLEMNQLIQHSSIELVSDETPVAVASPANLAYPTVVATAIPNNDLQFLQSLHVSPSMEGTEPETVLEVQEELHFIVNILNLIFLSLPPPVPGAYKATCATIVKAGQQYVSLIRRVCPGFQPYSVVGSAISVAILGLLCFVAAPALLPITVSLLVLLPVLWPMGVLLVALGVILAMAHAASLATSQCLAWSHLQLIYVCHVLVSYLAVQGLCSSTKDGKCSVSAQVSAGGSSVHAEVPAPSKQ